MCCGQLHQLIVANIIIYLGIHGGQHDAIVSSRHHAYVPSGRPKPVHMGQRNSYKLYIYIEILTAFQEDFAICGPTSKQPI